MAIEFARLQYVSRSTGGNACLKGAYNERSKIVCNRSGQSYSFAHKGDNVHHEILLPEGVDSKFKHSALLWNEVEWAEKRQNSQVAKEMVLALPDDVQLTLEDRITLARQFVQENFVEKGLAAQLDIHAPHEGERNWHAHVLMTTRRFTSDGKALGQKARDLDAEVRKGFIVEGEIWGEKWRECQNAYFKKKGYALEVDEVGLLPQPHLGPVRMRSLTGESDLRLRAEFIQQANEQLARDPSAILEFLTRNKATFTERDMDLFLKKHVDEGDREGVKTGILGHPSLLQLHDRSKPTAETGWQTRKDLFTTTSVREEEKKIVGYADLIHSRNALKTGSRAEKSTLGVYGLTPEQKEACRASIGRKVGFEESGLVIIQGRAGTGKSYTLSAIRDAYERDKRPVMGLAPTNTVVQDLKTDAGFREAKTVHKMLFDHKNGRDSLPRGGVLIVDEAGMLSNETMTELLHTAYQTHSKVILVGDDRQLASVSRGGMFGYLAERYGSLELTEIRRQEVDWQKDVSRSLSEGDTRVALTLLEAHGRVNWYDDEQSATRGLVELWGRHHEADPKKGQLIITHTNSKVYQINQMIRQHLKETGSLGEVEYECLTAFSKSWDRSRFSEGDRIQFTQTDKRLGINNGIMGTLQEVRETEGQSLGEPKGYEFVVKQDNGQEVRFDPSAFHGFTWGYASTVYKAQGKTKPLVYVYHEGQGSQSLSYVALTRQKEDLYLFTSRSTTKDLDQLTKQMSREEGKESSLRYATRDEIALEATRQDARLNPWMQPEREGKISSFFKQTVGGKVKELTEEVSVRAKEYWNRGELSYVPESIREIKVEETKERRPGERLEFNRLDSFHRERSLTQMECDRVQLEKRRSVYWQEVANPGVKRCTPALDRAEALFEKRQREIERKRRKARERSRGLEFDF